MALPTPLRVMRLSLCSLALVAVQAQAQDESLGLTARDEAAQAAVEQADTRRELERDSESNPLAITVYRRNYLLPWTYNTNPNQADFDGITNDGDADKAELKFQISLKVNVLDNLVGNNGDLYFAYTQRSWWQAYNSEASSPFRETNYEPEAFISFDNRYTFLGWTNTQNRIGYAHQSNGQSEPLSRSWNRLYADFLFQRGDWAVSIAPHWRIPESDEDDDNPDLEDYIGYGDVTVVHAFGDQELSLLVRGNPGKHHYGAQLDYTFPLVGKVRGHVQYYDGYGESLIDHDQDVQRLGIGFSLNTFLSGVPGTESLVR
ncbi:phospholipase A [Halomonas sp. McH1-25]|uniref:phospholipase A n=1 Tax=unclassified Halomonas TaxID=2609666 RepID=UPI001EF54F1B|nr:MULTISPECIES: phospholipase A [unclassified Halomonas]MCG7600834.1 phospholipase A [Halomonas sp. McH1-25]MCP1344400.1 phospholipase A [Halomonas sp. FL8]MCP1362424.1 phospholipase A [Halomonas sp. BBD45]MCP1364858.1 phospholipase A [Halomonas sp. BBD48]